MKKLYRIFEQTNVLPREDVSFAALGVQGKHQLFTSAVKHFSLAYRGEHGNLLYLFRRDLQRIAVEKDEVGFFALSNRPFLLLFEYW